ncbi:hypothetical protein JCM11251_000301 [Rhodosporidiobolus azoricus]
MAKDANPSNAHSETREGALARVLCGSWKPAGVFVDDGGVAELAQAFADYLLEAFLSRDLLDNSLGKLLTTSIDVEDSLIGVVRRMQKSSQAQELDQTKQGAAYDAFMRLEEILEAMVEFLNLLAAPGEPLLRLHFVSNAGTTGTPDSVGRSAEGVVLIVERKGPPPVDSPKVEEVADEARGTPDGERDGSELCHVTKRLLSKRSDAQGHGLFSLDEIDMYTKESSVGDGKVTMSGDSMLLMKSIVAQIQQKDGRALDTVYFDSEGLFWSHVVPTYPQYASDYLLGYDASFKEALKSPYSFSRPDATDMSEADVLPAAEGLSSRRPRSASNEDKDEDKDDGAGEPVRRKKRRRTGTSVGRGGRWISDENRRDGLGGGGSYWLRSSAAAGGSGAAGATDCTASRLSAGPGGENRAEVEDTLDVSSFDAAYGATRLGRHVLRRIHVAAAFSISTASLFEDSSSSPSTSSVPFISAGVPLPSPTTYRATPLAGQPQRFTNSPSTLGGSFRPDTSPAAQGVPLTLDNDPIAAGSTGLVYSAYVSNGVHVAVKQARQGSDEEVEGEGKLIKALNAAAPGLAPQLVGIYRGGLTRNRVALVMDWGGEAVKDLRDLSEEDRRNIFHLFLQLHNLSIVHGDPRLPNILHDKATSAVKLIDFGRSYRHKCDAPSLPSTFSLPQTISQSLSTTSSAPSVLNCWVRSVRRQKNISFVTVSDGSHTGGVQVVLKAGMGEDLTVGCSAAFEGEWAEQQRSPGSKEFQASSVSLLGASDAATYPMPNTKQGIPLPLMRKNAHLRARKEGPAALLRLRSEMNWALTKHFREQDFARVEMPIITSSDCEGAGEVFRVVDASPSASASAKAAPDSSPSAPSTPSSDIRSEPTPSDPSSYLTVSTQLHLEAIASSLPRVYTFAPCFRAEKSDTARHLQEFWMLEAECAFLDKDVPTALGQVMDVAEDAVRAVATHVKGMKEFEGWFVKQSEGLEERVEALLSEGRWPRMTYTRAVELLQEKEKQDPKAFKFRPIWEAGLQTEHEKWLAEDYVKGPLFVTDYPTDIKPFYMLPNEPSSSTSEPNLTTSSSNTGLSPSSRQTTACFDLLVPALGELAGGSLREHRPSALLSSLEKHGLDPEAYDWYLDLRRYGTTRHGGFGMGWERLVGLLTGEGNVRECVAFPRAAEGSRF